MKIIHILNSLGGGGIQNLLLSLAPEQSNYAKEVSVIVIEEILYDYSNSLRKKLEENRVKVYCLNKKPSNKISLLRTLFKCVSLIKSKNPDIINTHGEMSHFYGGVVSSLLSIKHCITIHNGPERWNKLNYLLNSKKPLIFCSKSAFELKEQQNKNYTIIENGVSIDLIKTKNQSFIRKELDLKESDKLILLVGSLRPQKNYEFLKDIVNELKNDSIHFLICGGNYGKGYIEESVFDNYSTIHCLGLRGDVSALENECNLFLSCATFEGLPIAVLEAFFNGIPCLLSPIEQHISIAKNIPFCYIPKDFTANSFASLIIKALANDTNHSTIYENRKAFIEQFSISKTAKNYIDYYRNIIV